MKKLLTLFLLIAATVISINAQELPIYSPVKIYGNLTVTGDVIYEKWNNQTDTMGMVIGKDGKGVLVPLVLKKAADAWDSELVPFDEFYKEAKEAKALPFPSPDGTENRRIVPFNYYSIEYEIERVNMYLHKNFNADKVRTILIILLFVGFLYQQGQIIKLKKGK